MIEIWNSHIQDNVVWYPSTASRLYRILLDFFGGCMDAFKKYCAAIANTKFLMGKSPNSKFKAFFYWAIKPEVIKSIFQGAYGVKDILSKIVNESEEDRLEKEYNSIDYEILNAETKIKNSRQKIIDAQEKSIQEYRQTISEKIKDEIHQVAIREIDQTHPVGSCIESMRKMLVNVKSHQALIDFSRSKLNLCNPDEIKTPQELIDSLEALKSRRVEICKRFQEIVKENQKKKKEIESLVDKAA